MLAYIRAVPQFAVEQAQEFAFGSLSLRRFTLADALAFSEFLRRRDVFARHAGDRDTYTARAKEFADKVVLVASTRDSHRDVGVLRQQADAVEALVVLSETFASRRAVLHRYVAGRAFREPVIDLYLDGIVGKPRTKKHRGQPSKCLPINNTVARRYRRLGFEAVQLRADASDLVGKRLRLACHWLVSSRLDPDVGSAFIKTATAAESLIADDSTSGVTKKLSRRVARLVGADTSQIADVETALRTFYGTRCDFAHGRHAGGPTPQQAAQLEVFDRLVTLALSSFAVHCTSLSAPASVGSWFKTPVFPLALPFSRVWVQRALALV